MKNIYLFYGEEDFLIKNAIDEIVKNHPNGQVVRYDLSETNVSILLEDASMVSLFDDEKVIIGENADFLSGALKKETVNHNIESLSKYLEHPNPSTTVIFTVFDKLDKRKNIVKKMLEKTSTKEFTKLNDNGLMTFAKNICEKADYQISLKALTMLIDRVGNNLYLLHSECEKLMLYKAIEKKIDDKDIEEMIVKYDFDNIFALTDAVIKRDINTSLTLYQELLKRNEEPIKIIVLLANQFRLIFQVKRMSAKGFSEGQIASDLGVHPYRVKLANEVKLNSKELLKYISALADLDENIKMGKVNKDVGLELFLLKL